MRKGYTMIELVASIVIFGVLFLGAVYGIFRLVLGAVL